MPRSTHDGDFDVIVIGSGIGGMSCGSLLSSLRGLRVAVLERHFRLGGYAQQFTRPGGLRWDTGLHYVGGMDEGSPQRMLMDAITGHAVEWTQFPDLFEHYSFPDFTIDQPTGARAWRDVLVSRWPAEAQAIDRYFTQVDIAAEWFMAHATVTRGSKPSQVTTALPLAITRSVLDGCGLRCAALRAVLTAQWGNYGVPPGASAFASHALVTRHFLDGGWYPRGGGDAFVQAARRVIAAAGGVCMVRHHVRRIILERGRAIGVEVESGPQRTRRTETMTAATIVSDAGAAATYFRLLPDDGVSCAGHRAHITSLRDDGAALQLFLGLSASPATLGLTGANHWLFTGLDLDALCAGRDRVVAGDAPSAFVSFPSLNDPSLRRHAAIVVAPISRTVFSPWAASLWKRRGPEYDRLKEQITDALLRLVEERIPGFCALIDYAELATPLSAEHFTGHDGGAIYGLPAIPQRFTGPAAPGPVTPVPGLLLTGSDAFASGIVGAALGGALAAGQLLGPGGAARLLAAVRQRSASPAATTWGPA